MNPKSAMTFVWASLASMIVGMTIMSPAGSLFFYLLATLFALVPIISGGKRVRVGGVVILALSIALLAATYPEYDAETTRYKQRTHQ